VSVGSIDVLACSQSTMHGVTVVDAIALAGSLLLACQKCHCQRSRSDRAAAGHCSSTVAVEATRFHPEPMLAGQVLKILLLAMLCMTGLVGGGSWSRAEALHLAFPVY